MVFDVHDKANKPLLDYLSSRIALVVDTSSASRSTVRKLLGSLGMKTSNVDTAENYPEAEEFIQSKKPQIIFSDYALGGKSGLDLFALQKKQYPNRLDTIFFVLSDKNSPMIASRVAEEEADGLIVRPFTFTSLLDKFVEAAREKTLNNEYLQAVEAAKQILAEGKRKEALEAFQKAQTMDEKPVQALFYEGLIHHQDSRITEAMKSFERGLEINPTHYKCLTGLFDLLMETKQYERAYGVGGKISQSYPISPKRIPDFVRLSVMNRKYEDILSYFDLLTSLEATDTTVANSVSAGLVVCAKYFLQKGNTSDAVAALRKAHAACNGKTGIIKEIVVTYYNAGLKDEAKAILSASPPDVKDSTEIRMVELEQAFKDGPMVNALQISLNLIAQGTKDTRIFEIALMSSVAMKRRPESIQELLENACRTFPDKKDFFTKLATPSTTT